MRMVFRSIGGLALLMALILGTVASTSAAHNGNNRAEISGTAVEPDATGQAIVNYSEGKGTFNGTITVRNLIPGATYRFFVQPGNQLICSGEAGADGTFTCSAQGLTLAGFSTAEVRDSANVVVATGTFERRGNCRDPEQANSQCDAPGLNK